MLRYVIEFTPLYQAVELLRDLTTGRFGWVSLVHVAYLAAVAALGLGIASRRMTALLCK